MPPKASTPDFAALLDTISQVGGPRLRIDAVLEALPDDQRPKVLAALRDTNISSSRIGKALTKMGREYAASEGAVTTWRERHGIS